MNASLVLELVRIGLRYLGMFLVAKGVFDPQTATSILGDPALVEIIAGAVAAGVAEVGYAMAKVRGARK